MGNVIRCDHPLFESLVPGGSDSSQPSRSMNRHLANVGPVFPGPNGTTAPPPHPPPPPFGPVEACSHVAGTASWIGTSSAWITVRLVVTGGAAHAKWLMAAFAGSLFLAACAEAAPPGAGTSPVTTSASSSEPGFYPDLDSPPPVTVRFFDQSIDLHAWTYCYGNVCADGSPPAETPDVGSPQEVVVEFPLSGWSFTASFRPTKDECGRVQQMPLESTGGGAFVLRPAGYADTYDVTLFGQGDGDLFVTFRWTTPIDGTLPPPEARLAVLADHDGQVDSYGVELEVTNLARTPKKTSASITVRSATGETVTFEATRSDHPCLPEGTVYWDGPDNEGLEAAALGNGPFTYEVELVLDGVRYVATAAWPQDEIVGNEPSVALDFTPDLPALS
jgi:hypothetical protein